jgi:hypothetical protein
MVSDQRKRRLFFKVVIPSEARNLLFLASKEKQIPRCARNDKSFENGNSFEIDFATGH